MPLNSGGYQRKRLEEIKIEIETDIIAEFGEVNTQPDSVFGQLIGIFAKKISDIYQDNENLYFSMYPSTAEGLSLDNAVGLVGISRLAATFSRVNAAVTGDHGTAIIPNSQVEVEETGETFVNPSAVVINRNNALIINVEVVTLADNTDYSVLINGTPIIVNSNLGSTLESIAIDLVDAINLSAEPVTAEIVDGASFRITADDLEISFGSSVSNNIEYIDVTSPAFFEATVTGPITVLPGKLNVIVTPISGWDAVTNFFDGIQGRARETDQELRLRRRSSLAVIGAASIPAIRSNLLQNVQDVTGVIIFENREPFVDAQGRPGHSFEAVVEGGADQEIAEEIWRVKPAGIQTFGNVTNFIIDSNNDQQAIYFSRPEPLYLWVQVELDIVAGAFPSEGITSVTNSILDTGALLDVGEDVLFQSFYGAIYTTAGIQRLTLTLATSSTPGGPPSAYVADNINVSEVQIALFDVSRINISIA